MDFTSMTNLLWSVSRVLYLLAILGAVILVAVRARGRARKLGLVGFILFVASWLSDRVLSAVVSSTLSVHHPMATEVHEVIGFVSQLLVIAGIGMLVLAVCAHPRPGPPTAAPTMR